MAYSNYNLDKSQVEHVKKLTGEKIAYKAITKALQEYEKLMARNYIRNFKGKIKTHTNKYIEKLEINEKH
jgi:hypothetical protein